MDMVNIKINGMACEVPAGSTILEAAREAGIDIPTLCFLKDINQIGACRMCMVEVKGARSLVAACVYPVNEGMEVFTNTPKVQKSRKMTLELLLSVHDRKCLSCKRSGTCELQKLCNDMGIDDENRFEGAVPAGKEGLLHAASRARQREVHPLPPLRRGLPAAARRRDRREQPRL